MNQPESGSRTLLSRASEWAGLAIKIRNAPQSRIRRLWWLRLLYSDKVALSAAIALAVIIAGSLLVPTVQAPEVTVPNLAYRNQPPATKFDQTGVTAWLGTDYLGRDLLTRMAEGGRVSITIALAAGVLSGILGSALGLIAGYRGKRTDDLIMRISDLQMTFPGLLLAMFMLYVLGPGLLNVVLVLAIFQWPLFARTARGMALSLRTQQFIEAAEGAGASASRIIYRHLLPNILPTMIILGTLQTARIVQAEAGLSFIGLGVQAPQSSWGLMLAQGTEYMNSAWWLISFPGVAIVLFALAANLLAQWFQQIADPLQRP